MLPGQVSTGAGACPWVKIIPHSDECLILTQPALKMFTLVKVKVRSVPMTQEYFEKKLVLKIVVKML